MDPPFSFRSLALRWSLAWKGAPGEVRDGGLDSGVPKSKPCVILEFSLGRSSSPLREYSLGRQDRTDSVTHVPVHYWQDFGGLGSKGQGSRELIPRTAAKENRLENIGFLKNGNSSFFSGIDACTHIHRCYFSDV